MQCTLQNLSEEYFHTFMTNMSGILGQLSGILLTTVVVVPLYSFYSVKLSSFVHSLKETIVQQTYTQTHEE
jgi:hypothetical protein